MVARFICLSLCVSACAVAAPFYAQRVAGSTAPTPNRAADGAGAACDKRRAGVR